MDIIIIALLIAIVFGILLLLINLKTLIKRPDDDKTFQVITMLQNQVNNLNRELSTKMSEQREMIERQLTESNKSIREQYAISSKSLHAISDSSSKIIKEVTEKLTKVDETNKQIISFASQLQSLENILKNPKQRGILGEYFLETLLGNVLPQTQYKMQYQFKDGTIADAVIFLKGKIIPIDAKFSLENYNKIQQEKDLKEKEKLIRTFKTNLKNRIDETSKYVKPDENTTDFAFMFIPAEGIFYDLLVYRVGSTVNSKDLIEYAYSKHVVIVSPNSFFAYLQTIIQALKNLSIEKSVQDIVKNMEKLHKHIKRFDENMIKLGKHLGLTVSSYNDGYREFSKINQDIDRITNNNTSVEILTIDKPEIVN